MQAWWSQNPFFSICYPLGPNGAHGDHGPHEFIDFFFIFVYTSQTKHDFFSKDFWETLIFWWKFDDNIFCVKNGYKGIYL